MTVNTQTHIISVKKKLKYEKYDDRNENENGKSSYRKAIFMNGKQQQRSTVLFRRFLCKYQ